MVSGIYYSHSPHLCQYWALGLNLNLEVNMLNNNLKIVVSQDMSETKSKEEHISDYIESLKTIEDAMEPYKEQKRELKKEYLDKKWLSKEDISLSVRALRLLKDDVDIAALLDMYSALESKHGKKGE
tara:strand:+ start:826 stop:1206 length:381 start_codon:yes stop_codon:yes gene_type:complete